MADTDIFASFLADFWNTGNVTDYRALLEDARYTLHRVNRTMARDRFHSIADSDNITIVMNHDRAEEAVVMMRGVVLAGLLDSVAQAAVRRNLTFIELMTVVFFGEGVGKILVRQPPSGGDE